MMLFPEFTTLLFLFAFFCNILGRISISVSYGNVPDVFGKKKQIVEAKQL